MSHQTAKQHTAERREAVRAQGKERAKERALAGLPDTVPDLAPMACGGGKGQME